MFNTPEDAAARDATRAACARTGCTWISQQAAFGGGRIPCLVIYRPSGSSIVINLADAMSVRKYCAFVTALTRESIREHILLEAQKLDERSRRFLFSARLRAADHALNDADFLRHTANSIPATN